MNHNVLVILLLSILSCNESNLNRSNKSYLETTLIQIDSKEKYDTLTWINSFRIFQDAIYQRDIEKVKGFFNFPIMNQSNEIWYLVYEGNIESIKLLSDEIKPFTEKDFELYFDKIFPQTFVRSINKIKSEELFKIGETESIELKEGKTTYKAYATYSKESKTLTLNLAFNTPIKTIDGEGQEIEEPGEYNIIYIFNVLDRSGIKFKQIRLAG